MSSRHRTSVVSFLVGPDKQSPVTRYDRGLVITSQAPQSPLYQQHPDMKASSDELIHDTVDLKAAIDAHTQAEANLTNARSLLLSSLAKWDGAYAVFTTTGEKYALVPADAHGLGAVAAGSRVAHVLAMPVSVTIKYDPKKNVLRVHVLRAPGPRAVAIELSPDPVTPTSWVPQPGAGAIHVIPNPSKGTWWVRACTSSAKAQSDFTTPVSVIVK